MFSLPQVEQHPWQGPKSLSSAPAIRPRLAVLLSKDAHHSLSSNVRLYPGDKVIIPRAGSGVRSGRSGPAGRVRDGE